jgi:ABC-type proline/glycine betaine transport system ATPase subunit
VKIKPEAHSIGSVKPVLAAVILSFLLWVTVGRADDRVTSIRLDWAYYNPLSLVLKDKKWLEDEFKNDGIEIQWTQSLGSNKALELLRSKSVDFGGMAQRVAIARALVAQPSLILLDEPFSALDAVNRLKLQNHLLQIWEADRPTMLVVTHDVEEAVFFGERVIVLGRNSGKIEEDYTIDLPRPRNRIAPEFQRWKETILKSLDPSLVRDANIVEEEKYARC